jgi:hypothetical protein
MPFSRSSWRTRRSGSTPMSVLGEILLLPGAALEEGLVDAGKGSVWLRCPTGGMIGAESSPRLDWPLAQLCTLDRRARTCEKGCGRGSVGSDVLPSFASTISITNG